MEASRFWERTAPGPGDCIDWTGSQNSSGYGQVSVCGRRIGAHRYALILSDGPERMDRFALHSCDRPICVNPKHLRWGTAYDNTQDASDRDRLARGIRHPRCTVNAEQIHEIRRRKRAGAKDKDIAPLFSVSVSTIRYIHPYAWGGTHTETIDEETVQAREAWIIEQEQLDKKRAAEMRARMRKVKREREAAAKAERVRHEAVATIRRRVRRGEKQVAIARELGVSESHMSHFLAGRRRLPAPAILRVVKQEGRAS